MIAKMLRYQEVHALETYFQLATGKAVFLYFYENFKYPILNTIGSTYSLFVQPKGLPNIYGSTRPMNFNFPGSN